MEAINYILCHYCGSITSFFARSITKFFSWVINNVLAFPILGLYKKVRFWDAKALGYLVMFAAFAGLWTLFLPCIFY